MDRFIVGTGRCGSTLLSRMLAHNRRVLSMSEFWSVIDRDAVFASGECTGAEVLGLISRPNLLNDLVISRAGFLDAAVTGHSIRKEARGYALLAHRLPAFRIFLNTLSEDHEGLIAAVQDHVARQRRQTLVGHWHALWDFLTQYLGRDVWIERSGVSIEHVGRVACWYPQAKFIHLHRDGPTNALGIRAFRHFVLYASFFLDPPSDHELQTIFTCEIGSAEDPIMRRMGTHMPSLEQFGQYWSWQIAQGQRELLAMPVERRLFLEYEDMVANTAAVLERIAEFFRLPADDGWIERACKEVDPEGAPDRASALAEEELRKLKAACRPGMVMLGRETANPFEEAMASTRRVFASMAPERLNHMK